MPDYKLNSYQIMWLFVFFDLPTETKQNRKDAAKFRKELEKDGFSMMQYSVYIRHCPSKENAIIHVKRVQNILPREGQISLLEITDKQYGDILNFIGSSKKSPNISPQQLELF